jgi:hypothetical protein
MAFAATDLAPQSYYDELAKELESIADALCKSPNLNQHFAGRLKELAKQVRDDARLMRLAGK